MFSKFGVAQVSPIQHRPPLVLLARDARASACARLRFLPWQPGWEIRVSGSDVYPTLRGGSATARLRFFRLACVADQISRSAARIVFATLRGGSDFRDCNENILLFFSSTQAREIRAAARRWPPRRWRKSRARSLRGERGITQETVKSLGCKKKNFPPGYAKIQRPVPTQL